MKNDLTVNDIKNSVEYQWRKRDVKHILVIWLISIGLTFLIPVIVCICESEFVVSSIEIWLFFIVFSTLITLPLVIFLYSKMRYLLKNYQKFNSYEVILDKDSASDFYRDAVYYTVVINDGGLSKKVDTNPYFSNCLLSIYFCRDYNDKKVVGLYDGKKDKFYIVRKVD